MRSCRRARRCTIRALRDVTKSYAPLGLDALASSLRELPRWHCEGGTRLVRTVVPADLWTLLQKVVDVEGDLDHHAEVTLEDGTVTFTLWTHVRDAVTAADVELARRIDQLADALGVSPGPAAPADRG